MRIRMLTVMCGPDVYRDAGAVVEVPQAEADELIAGRYAEPADLAQASATPESAADAGDGSETATSPAPGAPPAGRGRKPR